MQSGYRNVAGTTHPHLRSLASMELGDADFELPKLLLDGHRPGGGRRLPQRGPRASPWVNSRRERASAARIIFGLSEFGKANLGDPLDFRDGTVSGGQGFFHMTINDLDRVLYRVNPTRGKTGSPVGRSASISTGRNN